ncbi:MAG: ComEC/Rec2 family competence protein, partial [Candidatus Poribacteria bacterium]
QKIGTVINELSSDYETVSIFKSLILGEGGEVSLDLYKTFQKTGTTHVLVVSGVNFAILAGWAYWLFNAIRKFALRAGKNTILLEKEIVVYIPVFVIIILYLLIANKEFSVFRAFIFITLFILGVIINRDRDVFNILAIAGLIILIFIPGAFWNAGFQLSFVTVASITYLMPYFEMPLKKIELFKNIKEKKWYVKTLYWFIQGVFVSISAQLGAVTIISYNFRTFAPIGFFVNSLIFPLIFVITPTAFALCIIGLVSIHLANLFSWVNNFLINFLIYIVRWFSARVDYITIGAFSLTNVFFIAGVIIFLVNLPRILRKNQLFSIELGYEPQLNLGTIPDIVRYEFDNKGIKLSENTKLIVRRFGKKWLITDNPSNNWFDKRQAYIAKKCKDHIAFYRFNQKPLIYSLALISLLCWAVAIEYDGNVAKITYLDVREADSIFVQFPNKYNILIDGGSYSQRFDCGERIVAPFLKRNGVGKLDLVIATHPDNDHIGGLVYVVDHIKIDKVITGSYGLTSPTYNKFLEKLKINNISYQDASPSVIYEDRDFKVEILSDRYYGIIKNSESELNNNSVVVKITYKNASFLFTGDIERQAEQQLVRSNVDLKAHVLKVPHHGSRSSSTYEFINAVQPFVAVISVGYRNFFGHPHFTVIRRYENANIKIYRTDINGAIT